MKKLFAVFLALVLACGCLAGCGKYSSLGFTSASTQGAWERFVELSDGEKAFNFTAKEFKNNFNNKASKGEEKIRDWERVAEDDSIFYRYKYGEDFYLGVTEDSENERVKFLMLSYGLLGGNDPYLWGEVTLTLFSVVDPSLDSAARKDLFEKLDFADVDSWYIGKEGYTIKNDISYGVSIDENHNVMLTILPVPDGISSDSSRVNEPSSLHEETTSKQSVTTEKVLLDQNGIKITFTGVKQERSYTNLKLKIENNTDIDITVQERDMSINDIMISGVFSPTIAAGKVANDEISLFTSDLEENGITQIEKVELKFFVFDDNTLDTILKSQAIAFDIQ